MDPAADAPVVVVPARLVVVVTLDVLENGDLREPGVAADLGERAGVDVLGGRLAPTGLGPRLDGGVGDVLEGLEGGVEYALSWGGLLHEVDDQLGGELVAGG